MNIISTGAFLPEMDASTKQGPIVKSLVKAWEKKNAKTARAGGVSLMALSLAACGSSDDESGEVTFTQAQLTAATAAATAAAETVAATAAETALADAAAAQATAVADATAAATTTTPAAPSTPSTFDLTPLNDTASSTMAANGTLTSTFRFSTSNETVNGITATMSSNDVLIDPSSTDSDTLAIIATGTTVITTVGIENVTLNAASGTVNLNAASLTGITSVEVTGALASTVDNAAAAATIKSDSYGRILTVDDANYDGTTAAKNPDTLNLEVSGGTWGSAASSQTGFSLISDIASTIEVVNVTSSGSTANVYDLDGGTNVTLATVNFLGGTDAQIRVDHDDVTGLTLVGTAATGSVDLRVDMNSTTAALNATSFSGIDNFIMADSTVGSDAASITGISSGQKVTIADDMDATTITVSAAAIGSEKDSVSIVLDNESASTDLDVANITIDNVKTLNLDSSGYSTSSATAGENSTGTIDGDFTTITITGDTSLDAVLDIDGGGSAETTARTVTVNASANTGFVTIDAVDDKYVSYVMTGTDGNDTLKLNETAGNITGGAGNDTIHLSGKNDTVVAGAGKDTVHASVGTDTVSLGAGDDTIIMGEWDVSAVAQVTSLDNAASVTLATGDAIVANVNGSVYTQVFATDAATTHTTFVSTHSAAILANHGVTVTAVDTNTDLSFAGTAGTAFTLNGYVMDAAVNVAYVNNAVTANVAGISTNTVISDFEAGGASSGGDNLSFDVSDINALVDDLADSTGDLTDTDAVVVHKYTVGTTQGATAVDAGANVVLVNYTTAINAVADVTTAIDANTITFDGAKSNTDGVVTIYYDADDATAVFGIMQTTDSTVWNNGLTFNEMGTMSMTSANYALLDATNFDFVA
jgi:hypothetical protein